MGRERVQTTVSITMSFYITINAFIWMCVYWQTYQCFIYLLPIYLQWVDGKEAHCMHNVDTTGNKYRNTKEKVMWVQNTVVKEAHKRQYSFQPWDPFHFSLPTPLFRDTNERQQIISRNFAVRSMSTEISLCLWKVIMFTLHTHFQFSLSYSPCFMNGRVSKDFDQ